jgi:hypothetical protein
MRLYNPEFLLLLLLVAWLWYREHRPRKTTTLAYPSLQALRSARPGWRVYGYRLLTIVRVVAMMLLVIALARPQKGNAFTQITHEGIAIMMVTDVSGSMGAKDFGDQKKDRITLVKEVFRQFVAGGEGLRGRPHDLVGFVSFASYPEFYCPLTLNHEPLLSLLDEVDIPGLYAIHGRQVSHDELQALAQQNPSIMDRAICPTRDRWLTYREVAAQYRDNPEVLRQVAYLVDYDVIKHTELRREIMRNPRIERQTACLNARDLNTAIGDALISGITRLNSVASKSKVLILLTDGQNNTGKNEPREAARLAKKHGIKIYTIGVGPKSGDSGVDEALLNELATTTGGLYRHAAEREVLLHIYRQIDEMERSDIESEYWEYHEWYALFALAGLCLLAGERLLSSFVLVKLP